MFTLVIKVFKKVGLFIGLIVIFDSFLDIVNLVLYNCIDFLLFDNNFILNDSILWMIPKGNVDNTQPAFPQDPVRWWPEGYLKK